ncbi:MAG: SPOR domain-containing protein [Candidatus Kryptonium sp.]|nr:SPOR domain-containing protein [Candidatus Kryptonium sp.]
MGKNEFLNLLSKRAGISYDEAKMFYDKFVQRFIKVLKTTQSLKISSFGEFKGKVKKSRKVIDPSTGFEKVIPSKTVVNFSPAKIFVEKVNIKYKNLKPVVVKARPVVVEESDSNEFNITFFELGGKREPVKLDAIPVEFEPVAKEVKVPEQRNGEDYLVLPDKLSEVEKFEEIEIDVPVFDFFEKKMESESGYEIAKEEVKINFGEVAMPEFNLSEEPRQPQEKKDAKKLFDDTQQREIPTMAFEYEETNQKRTGFWIFILVVFLIFLGGVVLLLNQYGYIHLWGEGKKVSKVEFPQTGDVVVTTPPEVKTKSETETPLVEGGKKEPVITPPRVEKPAASKLAPKTAKSYVIQVASFQDKKLADAFASDLKEKGYNAFVERAFVEWKGGNWYRVRVGFFDSFEQANEVAKKLKKDAKVERIWVSEATRSVTK